MTIVEEIVGDVRRAPDTRFLYLTSRAMGDVGGRARRRVGDMDGDPHACELHWSPERETLLAFSHRFMQLPVDSLVAFLCKSPSLHLTQVDVIDATDRTEVIVRSVPVAELLAQETAQRSRRKLVALVLWSLVVVLALALTVYSAFRSAPKRADSAVPQRDSFSSTRAAL